MVRKATRERDTLNRPLRRPDTAYRCEASPVVYRSLSHVKPLSAILIARESIETMTSDPAWHENLAISR
jgi:hypothetical protein